MTNEQIVSEIQNGYSVTDHMQLLYENNLPLISLTLSDTLRADLSVENETIDNIVIRKAELKAEYEGRLKAYGICL